MMLTRNGFHSELRWVNDLRLVETSPGLQHAGGAMFQVDAIELLCKLPSNSVDLVMTSPPFALTRKKEYGNEPFDRYLEWFMPFCVEIKRVLKQTGSFVSTSAAHGFRACRFAAFTISSLPSSWQGVFSCAGILLVQSGTTSDPGRMGNGSAASRERCRQHGLVVWKVGMAQCRQSAHLAAVQRKHERLD